MTAEHDCLIADCGDPEHYCPCLDGVHDDCWWFYDGCCCHNRIVNGTDWFTQHCCPPHGCAHRNAQHEGIPARLAYVMNHQVEFGVSYPEY